MSGASCRSQAIVLCHRRMVVTGRRLAVAQRSRGDLTQIGYLTLLRTEQLGGIQAPRPRMFVCRSMPTYEPTGGEATSWRSQAASHSTFWEPVGSGWGGDLKLQQSPGDLLAMHCWETEQVGQQYFLQVLRRWFKAQIPAPPKHRPATNIAYSSTPSPALRKSRIVAINRKYWERCL
jgi:hypothetical protein